MIFQKIEVETNKNLFENRLINQTQLLLWIEIDHLRNNAFS